MKRVRIFCDFVWKYFAHVKQLIQNTLEASFSLSLKLFYVIEDKYEKRENSCPMQYLNNMSIVLTKDSQTCVKNKM